MFLLLKRNSLIAELMGYRLWAEQYNGNISSTGETREVKSLNEKEWGRAKTTSWKSKEAKQKEDKDN